MRSGLGRWFETMYWYILWICSFGCRCLTSLWFQLDFLNEILVIRPNSSSIITLRNWGWEVALVTNSQFTKRGENVYETTRREGEDCQEKGDNNDRGDNIQPAWEITRHPHLPSPWVTPHSTTCMSLVEGAVLAYSITITFAGGGGGHHHPTSVCRRWKELSWHIR